MTNLDIIASPLRIVGVLVDNIDGTHTFTLTSSIVLPPPPVVPPPVVPPSSDAYGYSGSLTSIAGGQITASGQTYINKRFTSGVQFFGTGGVVLDNCEIVGDLYVYGKNMVVKKTTAKAISVSSTQTATFTNCEVTGGSGRDGLHVTSDRGSMNTNINFDTCRVRAGVINDGQHYDGIQIRGVNGLTLRNVDLDVTNGMRPTEIKGAYDPRINASLFLENANGGNSNIVLDSCIFKTGGWYTFYLFATNISMVNCVIEPGKAGNLYPGSVQPNLFTGNRRANGTVITVLT